jgi:hypothetical protein
MRVADYRPDVGTTALRNLTIEITNTTDQYLTLSFEAVDLPSGLTVTTNASITLAPGQMELITISARAAASSPKGENFIVLEYIVDGVTYANKLPIKIV